MCHGAFCFYPSLLTLRLGLITETGIVEMNADLSKPFWRIIQNGIGRVNLHCTQKLLPCTASSLLQSFNVLYPQAFARELKHFFAVANAKLGRKIKIAKFQCQI